MTRGDRTGIVVFDVIGTLVDPEPLRARMAAAGAPDATFEAWFARMLHTATCLTLAGDFAPFAEIARTSLETTLAIVDLDPRQAPAILEPLAEGALPAFPDAAAAIDALNTSGWPLYALTNGSADQTRRQLSSVDLGSSFDGIVSVEEVGAYKPHPRTYQRVLEHAGAEAGRSTLVAAHGWDVVGARSVGLEGVWINRSERHWPIPTPQPATAADLVAAAALIPGPG
jgi:2-haloacid dehalogenase